MWSSFEFKPNAIGQKHKETSIEDFPPSESKPITSYFVPVNNFYAITEAS